MPIRTIENGYKRNTNRGYFSKCPYDKLLKCIEDGHILIDFDARTGHNHGTKFRLRQGHWPDLYDSYQKVI
jgi:hypothetical protein